MKRLITAIMLLLAMAAGARATVLFPHFVDVAPNYEDGLTPELKEAGVDCALYHSTTPGFMAANFTEAESFLKDTLPSDVVREERKDGDILLVIYTALNVKDDTINTNPLQSTIYLLRRPDDSFVAAYCEHEVE